MDQSKPRIMIFSVNIDLATVTGLPQLDAMGERVKAMAKDAIFAELIKGPSPSTIPFGSESAIESDPSGEPPKPTP